MNPNHCISEITEAEHDHRQPNRPSTTRSSLSSTHDSRPHDPMKIKIRASRTKITERITPMHHDPMVRAARPGGPALRNPREINSAGTVKIDNRTAVAPC